MTDTTQLQRPGAGAPARSLGRRLRRLVIGAPREINDPEIFQHVSLVAFLAWVGLGADGLSSSAYGPEEAYKALGHHAHMAPLLIVMTTLTIAVIAFTYSNLIRHFPGGGGGYLVATKLLGKRAGVLSGCALLVDYVLTITVSIASACDQLWSLLPLEWQSYKLAAAAVIICGLIVLNLRGVRESVNFLAPVFILFLVTHAFMIMYVVMSHLTALPAVAVHTTSELNSSVDKLGWIPVTMMLLRAYSLGGGTYTGIEAVSNGVATLREPKIRTGRRTMVLMALSLAFTAGGILLGYLLTDTRPVEGQTMNAALFTNLFGSWSLLGLPAGSWFVAVSLFAEAALLVVAAQAGFLDGPRVLANMAVDSWMPHRLAQLSDRLVTKNGVFMMGVAALAALLYTRGSIAILVVMYSINVFVTFSLTQLGMARHWIAERHAEPHWKSQLAIHAVGFMMCAGILTITVYEKFAEGGWVTTVLTGAAIAVAFAIRRNYRTVERQLRRLDELLLSLPPDPKGHAPETPIDKNAPTAVICVASFSGFGLHQILSIEKLFPHHFRNLIFVSAAVVDSGSFKGTQEIGCLRRDTEEMLRRYVDWAHNHGWHAEARMALGTEAVQTTEHLCSRLATEFPGAIFFTGKLIFEREKWHHPFLHNESAYSIQRRLQFRGLQTIVLPIRVLESAMA
ncbi:MAG: APC family permease [Deltaproteobacteria bacterium]|nr:APC family permease [Deltaproteobacteria bacterium]